MLKLVFTQIYIFFDNFLHIIVNNIEASAWTKNKHIYKLAAVNMTCLWRYVLESHVH